MKLETCERIRRWVNLLYLLPILVCLVACQQAQQPPQPTAAQQEAKLRTEIASLNQQVSKLEARTGSTKENPYFGSTYWDELLTSVYYYPAVVNDSTNSPAMTHLKFDHREDDIWLCGDQRKAFSPGEKYRLLVTFEPNQPCVTNWQVK